MPKNIRFGPGNEAIGQDQTSQALAKNLASKGSGFFLVVVKARATSSLN